VARFCEPQQNATNLNISVSQGSLATFVRCGGQCMLYIVLLEI